MDTDRRSGVVLFLLCSQDCKSYGVRMLSIDSARSEDTHGNPHGLNTNCFFTNQIDGNLDVES